ncbi:hypothetical protein [Roseateles sp. DXS20W]
MTSLKLQSSRRWHVCSASSRSRRSGGLTLIVIKPTFRPAAGTATGGTWSEKRGAAHRTVAPALRDPGGGANAGLRRKGGFPVMDTPRWDNSLRRWFAHLARTPQKVRQTAPAREIP